MRKFTKNSRVPNSLSMCSWYPTSSSREKGVIIPLSLFLFSISILCSISTSISSILTYGDPVRCSSSPSLLLSMAHVELRYSRADGIATVNAPVSDLTTLRWVLYSYRLASRMRGCSMWRVDRSANKIFVRWIYICWMPVWPPVEDAILNKQWFLHAGWGI